MTQKAGSSKNFNEIQKLLVILTKNCQCQESELSLMIKKIINKYYE